MQEQFPDILRKVRQDRKLSQENIAEELKIDATTYGRYEKGEVPIKFDQVAQLAMFYKLTLDEFYNYNNPNFLVQEPKATYLKRWSVPITVALDGTEETLQMWLKKLTAINSQI